MVLDIISNDSFSDGRVLGIGLIPSGKTLSFSGCEDYPLDCAETAFRYAGGFEKITDGLFHAETHFVRMTTNILVNNVITTSDQFTRQVGRMGWEPNVYAGDSNDSGNRGSSAGFILCDQELSDAVNQCSASLLRV